MRLQPQTRGQSWALRDYLLTYASLSGKRAVTSEEGFSNLDTLHVVELMDLF